MRIIIIDLQYWVFTIFIGVNVIIVNWYKKEMLDYELLSAMIVICIDILDQIEENPNSFWYT